MAPILRRGSVRSVVPSAWAAHGAIELKSQTNFLVSSEWKGAAADMIDDVLGRFWIFLMSAAALAGLAIVHSAIFRACRSNRIRPGRPRFGGAFVGVDVILYRDYLEQQMRIAKGWPYWIVWIGPGAGLGFAIIPHFVWIVPFGLWWLWLIVIGPGTVARHAIHKAGGLPPPPT